jgi:4-hydroxybenzoyl-CoA thioesterase
MPTTLIRDVSFGDCDPAGIVFYPNVFRWMDAAFHHLLRDFGGHTLLCRSLGGVGLGLVDASAQFRKPMRDGDRLEVRVAVAEWTSRSFTLAYEGKVDGATTFSGREVRCLFMRSEAGIVAADLSHLRSLIESQDV